MAGVAGLDTIRRAGIIYENDSDVCGGHRWFDAFGPGVTKYIQDFGSLAVDDSTGDPIEFVCTITEGGGATTTQLTDVPGGALLITAAGNDNDGIAMQLGGAGGGEWVSLDPHAYTYFGIDFKGNDVDQSDFLFGICITDTDCLGAVTDGMYFRSVDESSTMYFVLEKNSVESASAVSTLVDDTYTQLEFYVDGPNAMVYAYVDGALVQSIATSNASYPNDEDMRLTMEFLSGEASANTCTIRWVRLIHIR